MKRSKINLFIWIFLLINFTVFGKTVTVKLLNSQGAGISGAEVKYYDNGWHTVGSTNSDGKLEFDLSGDAYSFGVKYAGLWNQKYQNISNDPVVEFQTKSVTIQLKTEDGSPIEGGLIKYYGEGWREIGSTGSDGKVTTEMLPGDIPFAVSYAGLWYQKSQDIRDNAEVTFNTKKTTIKLLSSEGEPLENGFIKYYGNGWRDIGNTNADGEITTELLPVQIPFGIVYKGVWAQKSQNINDDPVVVFNTKKTTIKLLTENGDPLEGGKAKYYGGGWQNIGTTDTDGQVKIELLPASIPFAIIYGGIWSQKSVDTREETEVVFNTMRVDFSLVDSKGNPLEGGEVKYFGDGWKTIGTTDSDGKFHYEFLPNQIAFGMTYKGIFTQKNVDIRKNNEVNFNTVKATVSLFDSEGNGLEGAFVKYYGSGWRNIGETDAEGKVEVEILESNIPFGLYYKGLWTQKNQDIRNNVNVVFTTKKIVVSLSDSKGNPLQDGHVKYYGDGWKELGTTDSDGKASMELLPSHTSLGISYEGAWMQKNVNLGSSDTFEFNTVETVVKLLGAGGTGIEGAEVKYYASGWKTIGLTDNEGKVTKELLPVSYTFSVKHQTEYFSKSQNISNDNVVVFYTTTTADLQLDLSVDNATPKDKEEITLTFSLHNSGPSPATGVKVTASIPAGLTFVSAQTDDGSYDADGKIWTLDQVNVNETAELSLKLKADYSQLNSSSIDFAEASDFNLFLFGDLEQPSSQTEGKLAAGGNVVLSEYTVGASLNLPQPEDVLIVGENLTYNSGSVHNGNIVYGVSSNLPQILVGIPDGTFRQGEVIDFNAAEVHLKTIANNLANLESNVDTVFFQYGKLTLEGNNPLTNVFHIDGETFNSTNDYEIAAPNGSTVIVIVDGDSLFFGGGYNVYGTSPNNVLFVFKDATKLKIEGIAIYGSILAPYADVNFVSGSLYGQLIAKSLVGEGHMANELFVGYVPPETTLTVSTEIFTSNQDDPNSHPNNGENAEDDFAKLNISIQFNNSPNNGDNPDINWDQIAQFSDSEIVWCMSYDNDYKPLAGTWGGKIYRYSDNQWNVINNGMNADYIWDLENNQDILYAATERGIYYSTDNGNSWSEFGLKNSDVRSIDFDSENNLYAGVWGEGVFKYVKASSSWSDVSDGLGNLSVQAVLVDAADNVFAGTFGGGIYKSSDGGQTWTESNIEYKFIWSLAEDPNNHNKLYAGTYGGGMYGSISNGGTWSRKNSGLSSKYVYSIAVDPDGKLFISTWSGGVYYSDNYGSSWTNLGLVGFDASSVVLIPSPPNSRPSNSTGISGGGSTLYIGTGSGTIYSASSPVTENEDEFAIVNEFNLMQNYPNPFNPTTVIKYSIPAMIDGHQSFVQLKVYNVIGEEIATLVNEPKSPGLYEVRFDASGLPSGIYFYKLNYAGKSITKKMVLLK